MTSQRSLHKEKGRLVSQAAFPFLRWLHINGRFQNLRTRGLSPGRVLLGSRCKSGQSRTGARTDAMVSHLRKMSHGTAFTCSRQACRGKCPHCPRCSQTLHARPARAERRSRRRKRQRGPSRSAGGNLAGIALRAWPADCIATI